MELNQTPGREQAAAARETQYRTMLQMGAQELKHYLGNLLQENPVLEEDETCRHKEDDEAKRKLEWLETVDAQNKPYYESDEGETGDPMSNYGTVREQESLSFYLLSQLRLLELPRELKQAARYTIENLDDNGYLQEDIADMAACTGLPPETMERAAELIRSLEPAGVGARNLQECLRLQLLRRDDPQRLLALNIVKDYLEILAERNSSLLARQMKADEREVQEACDTIRALNPRPGAEFSKRQTLIYLNPDLFVVNFPGHFELLTNEYFFPVLQISEEYRTMLKTTKDPELKAYLSVRMRQAQWVIQGLERRRRALLACAEEIASGQAAFFRQGPGHLVPLSISRTAEQLGWPEEELELLLKDKYLQCSSGVYPLGYFFPRPQ